MRLLIGVAGPNHVASNIVLLITLLANIHLVIASKC